MKTCQINKRTSWFKTCKEHQPLFLKLAQAFQRRRKPLCNTSWWKPLPNTMGCLAFQRFISINANEKLIRKSYWIIVVHSNRWNWRIETNWIHTVRKSSVSSRRRANWTSSSRCGDSISWPTMTQSTCPKDGESITNWRGTLGRAVCLPRIPWRPV